ncbi:MAG: hypothetical protein CMC79_02670 [Flavobacteriaceae bacterium]|nr:hypothetical protein [Flavobacteriaceae bacterium]
MNRRNIVCMYLFCFILLIFNYDLFGQDQNRDLNFKYFGAAGWEISDDKTIVLIDPYLSRLKLGESSVKLDINSNNVSSSISKSDNRKSYSREDYYESDTVLIDNIIKKADYIFIHHSHFDHLSDVPYIAKKTGAKVIGTETTISILKAYGVDSENLYTVKGGEDYQFENLSVRVIPGIHSALADKHYFSSKVYKEGDIKAPLKIKEFIEGNSLMYFIRFKSHKVLTMGSMNFIERELEGLKPDILLAGINLSRFNMYKYDERLIQVTGFPKYIIPTHWDNFRLPYDFDQSSSVEKKIMPFIKTANLISPNSKVIIPKHLKSFKVN